MPPVRVTAREPEALVEGRLLRGDGYTILFGFNRGDKPAAAKFAVLMGDGQPAATNLETGETVQVLKDQGMAVVEKGLGPQEAWVVLIKER